MGKPKLFQDLALSTYDGGRKRWLWLYQRLRGAMQDGRLRAGTRLPSRRELAVQYGFSRGTVVAAFEQLQAEGFTSIERGSGTYVSSDLPVQPKEHGRARANVHRRAVPDLSARAKEMIRGVSVMPAPRSIGKAFRSYEPALDLFPRELWARVAIAEYLGSARGVRCSPEQICVTAGSQQGLDLIARMLVDPGDSVWMEDPAYPGAKHAFRAAGAKLIPVAVDEQGLQVSEGARLAQRARLAYVTPANQFPLGVTMSAERRLALIQWAAASGSWIVEDEYDAEYRYRGCPVAALQSLDRSDSVIYVGTFTKMLFNALRIGFIVLPRRLMDAFAALRSFVDRHPATLDQAVLAEFIDRGSYGQHVRKMRGVYGERLEVLQSACRKTLAGRMELQSAVAGMRTLGWLQQGGSDLDVAERARAAGLEVFPLSSFCALRRLPPALLLGFAACPPKELRRGTPRGICENWSHGTLCGRSSRRSYQAFARMARGQRGCSRGRHPVHL